MNVYFYSCNVVLVIANDLFEFYADYFIYFGRGQRVHFKRTDIMKRFAQHCILSARSMRALIHLAFVVVVVVVVSLYPQVPYKSV